MEEKAAGKLTESAERPGSLGDSTEEYVPAPAVKPPLT